MSAASASNRNLAERAAKEGLSSRGLGAAPAAAPVALTDADFGDLAATLSTMDAPPPPAVWASMRATLADIVTSSMSLRGELAAAKREAAAASAAASSRTLVRPMAGRGKTAFGATRVTEEDDGAGAGY